MVSRYEALTELLESSDDPSVELSFDELDRLVGGIPASARRYGAWWANTRATQPHARFRLAAGRRARVDFANQRAVFELGDESERVSNRTGLTPVDLSPTGERRSAVVEFEWLHAGVVVLGAGGLPKLPLLTAVPGVYRFGVTDRDGAAVGTIVGESIDLARRMSGYRTPGPTQSTNVPELEASPADRRKHSEPCRSRRW